MWARAAQCAMTHSYKWIRAGHVCFSKYHIDADQRQATSENRIGLF